MTVIEEAAAAAEPMRDAGRGGRSHLLRMISDGLESRRTEIVATAGKETHLGSDRLHSELTRTQYQLGHFQEVLEEGSYLEATLDSAGPTAMGDRPDLRRMLVPIGAVAVFGSSNFPLAFGVPGGDTVSALAAGCPVVAKVHSGHPMTSELCGLVIRDALLSVGLPPEAFGLVLGREAAIELVQHPLISAVGFTGSTQGGRHLHDIASSRPVPIPFYGELGSINPLIVSPGAARTRGQSIARGFLESVSRGFGQFCTKPGLLFVPAGTDGDALVALLASVPTPIVGMQMLTASIEHAFDAEVAARDNDPHLHRLGAPAGNGLLPALFEIEAMDVQSPHLQECFGPSALVVRYDRVEEMETVMQGVGGQLTATIHAEPEESDLTVRLTEMVSRWAGRIVYNGYPTGVAVSWAMHHGGPYPSSTPSTFTSVGATSLRRWLRPIAYQDAPAGVLPEELSDGAAGIPRRVDGRIVMPVGRMAGAGGEAYVRGSGLGEPSEKLKP